MRLFGPIFLFNLIRVTRQTRFFLCRLVYAILLFVLVIGMTIGYQILRRANGSASAAQLMGYVGEHFFLNLLALQFFAVLLLTPGSVATALSEEKQSRQLELLLTTDVGVGEIVLGKLLARLGMVFQLVLAGLPVLSLIQLFGGVQPSLIWTGYGITLLTLFSLGSVSILCSLYADSTPGAVVKSYLAPAAYFTLCWLLPHGHDVIATLGNDPGGHALLNQGIALWEKGNPWAVVQELRMHMQATGSLGQRPGELFFQYALFHGSMVVVCLSLTVLRLRRVYLRYMAREQLPAGQRLRRLAPWRRPPLRERPMLWKECFGGAASRLGPLWRMGSFLAALVAICLGLVIGSDVVTGSDRATAQQTMNLYLRIVGPTVLGLALLQIGVSAAGCLHGEKQALTWDSLVMTLISLRGILAGKWWGSLYATRYLLWVLGILLLLGIVTGAVHVLLAALIVLITLLGCSFTATVGIFFAVQCRTHFRAVIGTLVVIFLMNLGVPYLSPKTWAFLHQDTYYYPASPDPYTVWRSRRRGGNDDCSFRETSMAVALRSFSPVNLWQSLTLTPREVANPSQLDRERYEWEEETAKAALARSNSTLGVSWPHVARKSVWQRLAGVLFVLPVWLLLDFWLWKRSVRRLMLQLERVDEYPIRYWNWPPGA